jgi:hypothetical protein
MSATTKCDACNKRIRRNQHELLLRDFSTGQVVGHYHAPTCQGAAVKYFTAGVVLRATYLHPDKCGPKHERCDGGLREVA